MFRLFLALLSLSLVLAQADNPVHWDQDYWLPEEGNSSTNLGIPSLTQAYYNSVFDVHATASAKDLDLIFSTNGNYHLALRRFLNEVYFPAFPDVASSYLFTTSPPISNAQLQSGYVKVGNILFHEAQPHVLAGPGGYINNIAETSLSGPRYKFIRTYGNVILKRNGDTTINTFWDLVNVPAGRFASSDPSEGGSYGNYKSSVYNIALNNPLNATTAETDAAALEFQLFEADGVSTIGPPMHRSVPHVIATGQADAGLFFLHLAVTAMKENPGVFSAVYLSQDLPGETDDWEVLAQGQGTVLEGNRVGQFEIVRTTVDTTDGQQTYREQFMYHLMQEPFTQILSEVGLRRPEGFNASDFEWDLPNNSASSVTGSMVALFAVALAFMF